MLIQETSYQGRSGYLASSTALCLQAAGKTLLGSSEPELGM